MSVPSAKAGLEDMRLLFDYLEVYGSLDKVSRTLHALRSRSESEKSRQESDNIDELRYVPCSRIRLLHWDHL